MYYTKLIIPKISNLYKLYIYRSTSAESINTIAKVKPLTPNIIIDEATAITEIVDGKECYVIYDKPQTTTGVTYNGPAPNVVPTSEYETKISIEQINNYTYVNKLILNPLPVTYSGTMFYYSIIGVDETNKLITHLSKVNGLIVNSPFMSEGTRHIYSSEDGETWKYVSSADWDTKIEIGNIKDSASYDRFGNPFVEKVPIFKPDEVNISLRPVPSGNFMVLEIPNIWQHNNREYNFRKLKSYKVQNICSSQYGDFSEPTFQSLLPVTMEKMLILRKTDLESPDVTIEPFDADAEKFEIIRKDGIYYNKPFHRQFGVNLYNIPLGQLHAVFSEGSVQDKIKIQIGALSAHVYTYTIYTFDTYEKMSEPCNFVVTT